MRSIIAFIASVAISAVIAAVLVVPNAAESQSPTAALGGITAELGGYAGYISPDECEGQAWPYQTDECATAINYINGVDRAVRVITDFGQ